MPERSPSSRVADRVASVVLLCVLGAMTAVLFAFGVFVVFGADVCANPGVHCSEAGLTTSVIAIRWAPVVVLVLAIVLSLVRRARRRTVFWTSIIAIAVDILLVLGCVLLVNASIQGAPAS